MRAIPDGYTHNNKVLSDSILDTHTNAEIVRKAAVDKQEAADAWRNGWTDNTGPVTHPYGLMQRNAIPDGYTFNNGVLSDSIKKTHTEAEAKRASGVADQAKADEWRAGSTPNSGPVITYAQSLGQMRAIPDGYTHNNKVLADSILDTHTNAETVRKAAVDKQEAADAWRNGWTDNTGPVTHPYGLVQHRAIPDGYTFNNGVLSDSILKTHTDAETARAAAVSAQEKSDAWRNGFTANSGPVINYAQRYQLVQGQPGPSPTDYGFSYKTLNDKINTHNDLWWAEQNADVAKQTAVDAWRNGWTANTGPELPYTF